MTNSWSTADISRELVAESRSTYDAKIIPATWCEAVAWLDDLRQLVHLRANRRPTAGADVDTAVGTA